MKTISLTRLPLLLALLTSPLHAQSYETTSVKQKKAIYAQVKDKLPSSLKGRITEKTIRGREAGFPHRIILARSASQLAYWDEASQEVHLITPLSLSEKKELYATLKEASNVKQIPRDYLRQIQPQTMYRQEEVAVSFPIAYRGFQEDYIVYAEAGYYISLHHVPTEDGDVVTRLAIRCTRPDAGNAMQLPARPPSMEGYFPIPKEAESGLHRELQWDLIGQLSRLLSDRLSSCLYLHPLDKQAWQKGDYAGKFLNLPLTLQSKKKPEGEAAGPRENILSGMDKQLEASLGRHYPGLTTLATQYPASYFTSQEGESGVFQPLKLIIPQLEEQLQLREGSIYYLSAQGESFDEIAQQALEIQAKHIEAELKQLQADYARYLDENPIHHATAAQLTKQWKMELDKKVEAILGESGSLCAGMQEAMKRLDDRDSKKGASAPIYLGSQE